MQHLAKHSRLNEHNNMEREVTSSPSAEIDQERHSAKLGEYILKKDRKRKSLSFNCSDMFMIFKRDRLV